MVRVDAAPDSAGSEHEHPESDPDLPGSAEDVLHALELTVQSVQALNTLTGTLEESFEQLPSWPPLL